MALCVEKRFLLVDILAGSHRPASGMLWMDSFCLLLKGTSFVCCTGWILSTCC